MCNRDGWDPMQSPKKFGSVKLTKSILWMGCMPDGFDLAHCENTWWYYGFASKRIIEFLFDIYKNRLKK